MATISQDVPTTVFFDLGETLITGQPASWIPGAKTLLKELRAAKCKLGIISNTGGLDRAALAPFLPSGFDWSMFDDPYIVLSGEIGIEKPKPAIFAEALKRAPKGAIFCTESLEHSLASQLAGLPCLRVGSPPDANLAEVLAVLRAVGLVPPP